MTTITRRADHLDLRPIGIAAAAATIALSASVLLAAMNPFGFGPTGRDPVQYSPYVIASARLWELQRHQQSPYIDYAMRSAKLWEAQRLQQSPYAG